MSETPGPEEPAGHQVNPGQSDGDVDAVRQKCPGGHFNFCAGEGQKNPPGQSVGSSVPFRGQKNPGIPVQR